jgi:hypothetical protein
MNKYYYFNKWYFKIYCNFERFLALLTILIAPFLLFDRAVLPTVFGFDRAGKYWYVEFLLQQIINRKYSGAFQLSTNKGRGPFRIPSPNSFSQRD